MNKYVEQYNDIRNGNDEDFLDMDKIFIVLTERISEFGDINDLKALKKVYDDDIWNALDKGVDKYEANRIIESQVS